MSLTVHTLHFIGECPEIAKCGFWHKYLGLMSDGPHLMAEITIDTIESAVLIGFGFLLGHRSFKKEHSRFDKSHGISHDES
jgi:hypothetical protein